MLWIFVALMAGGTVLAITTRKPRSRLYAFWGSTTIIFSGLWTIMNAPYKWSGLAAIAMVLAIVLWTLFGPEGVRRRGRTEAASAR